MNFDRLAPFYRGIEFLGAGDALQRCRVALLEKLPPLREVLIYGEGNGQFLVEWLRRFPESQVTVVEMSRVMIRLAQERLIQAGVGQERIKWIEADALHWNPPPATYDLIVTCFFLDCFRQDQAAELISRMAFAAKRRAYWLYSDFQVPDSGWRRWRSKCVLALLYRFFRWTTQLDGDRYQDPRPVFSKHGFEVIHQVDHQHRLLTTEIWRRDGEPNEDGS